MPASMPPDPFEGDPEDPTGELAALDDVDEATTTPLSPAERESVLEDLEDLDVFATLLSPRGVKGLVVDCTDCGEEHFFGWELLGANLRHLLDSGMPRVHEPACEPDPSSYVTWEYARGYADGVLAAEETADR